MDETIERPFLRRLSARLGIVDSYLDQTGLSLRQTSDETRERLLAAMGYDVATESGARKALRALRRHTMHEWIAPVRVVRQRSKSLSTVRVRVPRTQAFEIEWRLTLVTEEDIRWEWRGTTTSGNRRMTLELPVRPPL
ncbi:MAG: hypothetical protein M3Z05_22800, partial [Gemmatimonadota bacterium]|nr:hypothetical protein [Gemmatimonadota bacterium]